MFDRSACIKALVASAVLVASTSWVSPASAQSAAARAQRLAKLEEDMSSDDANLRLGAFEEAMADPSIVVRNKALDLSLASTDRNLRSAGLLYSVCARQDLPIRYNSIATGNGFFRPLTGLTIVPISGCDRGSGIFRTQVIPGRMGRPEIELGRLVGQISGTRLTFRFVIADDIICEFSGSLVDAGFISGSMACLEEQRASSGAVPANVEVR